jgi:hypothetical protein
MMLADQQADHNREVRDRLAKVIAGASLRQSILVRTDEIQGYDNSLCSSISEPPPSTARSIEYRDSSGVRCPFAVTEDFRRQPPKQHAGDTYRSAGNRDGPVGGA